MACTYLLQPLFPFTDLRFPSFLSPIFTFILYLFYFYFLTSINILYWTFAIEPFKFPIFCLCTPTYLHTYLFASIISVQIWSQSRVLKYATLSSLYFWFSLRSVVLLVHISASFLPSHIGYSLP
jgi:hypothetical protein